MRPFLHHDILIVKHFAVKNSLDIRDGSSEVFGNVWLFSIESICFVKMLNVKYTSKIEKKMLFTWITRVVGVSSYTFPSSPVFLNSSLCSLFNFIGFLGSIMTITSDKKSNSQPKNLSQINVKIRTCLKFHLYAYLFEWGGRIKFPLMISFFPRRKRSTRECNLEFIWKLFRVLPFGNVLT